MSCTSTMLGRVHWSKRVCVAPPPGGWRSPKSQGIFWKSSVKENTGAKRPILGDSAVHFYYEIWYQMLLVVVCGWFVFSFNGVEDDQNISATISPPVLLGKSKVRGEILLKRSVLTQNYQDGETTKKRSRKTGCNFPKTEHQTAVWRNGRFEVSCRWAGTDTTSQNAFKYSKNPVKHWRF